MKTLLILLCGCVYLQAQAPGKVLANLETHTVTATVGPIACTFSKPRPDRVNADCSANGVRVIQTARPEVGMLNSSTGNMIVGNDQINWVFQMPVEGQIHYTIGANGNQLTDQAF